MSDDDDNIKLLKKNFSKLTDRERMVLKKRFGIDIKKGTAIEEIARQFEVTRERIREIEISAMKKLKNPGGDPDDAA